MALTDRQKISYDKACIKRELLIESIELFLNKQDEMTSNEFKKFELHEWESIDKELTFLFKQLAGVTEFLNAMHALDIR